ncbi:MAG: cell division protein SepF [Lachnospiraceae bacterium]|nr:cell division protein SepF [Lachnospiraceae bacterium]
MSKFIDKILDSMKLSDDDFDEDDDMLFDDDEEEEEEPTPRRSRFRKESPYREEEEEEVTSLRPARQRPSGNLVPLRSGARGAMAVCMVKPTSVEDSREICDTLLSGRTVVINLEGIHIEIAQRIIDFTSGACYSMGGNLQKISNYIFIVTPKTVELSGDFQDMMIVNDDMGISTLGLNI